MAGFQYDTNASDAVINNTTAGLRLGVPGAAETPLPTGGRVSSGAADIAAKYHQKTVDAMAATMPKPQAPQGPLLGYNTSSDEFFTGAGTFSLSNLTMADEAIQKGVLNKGATELPAGFQPTTSEEIQKAIQYRASNRGAWDATKEVGRNVVTGAASGIPEMLGKATQYFAPDEGLGQQAGAGLRNFADYTKEKMGGAPDTLGRGEVSSTFINAASSLAPSLTGMAATLAAPQLAIPAVIALFGGSQAQDTYEKAIAKGMDKAAASEAAMQTGAIEGIGEAIADVIGGKLILGGGKILQALTRSGKITAEEAVKIATDPAMLKNFAKSMAGSMGTEMATEFGQSAGEAAVEQSYGISDADPFEQGLEGAKTAAAMTAMLAPFGLRAHSKQASQRAALGQAINDFGSPVNLLDAAGIVSKQIEPMVGLDTANQWLEGKKDALGGVQEARVQDQMVQAQQANAPAEVAPTTYAGLIIPKRKGNGDQLLLNSEPTNLLADEWRGPKALQDEEAPGTPVIQPGQGVGGFGIGQNTIATANPYGTASSVSGTVRPTEAPAPVKAPKAAPIATAPVQPESFPAPTPADIQLAQDTAPTFDTNAALAQEAQARMAAPTPVVPAATAVPAIRLPANVKLTDKQRPVFEYIQQAMENNQQDEIVDAEGVLQYQKIADKFEIARGSAKSFIDRIAQKMAVAAGKSLAEMKTALRERAVAQRTVAPSDMESRGLSPALQSNEISDADVFGAETGAEQSMGIISSVGGSQGEIGKDEQLPASYVDSVEPSDKARVEAEANRAKWEVEATQVLSSEIAVTAGLDWNDAKSDTSPEWSALTLLTRAEFVLQYQTQLNADDSWQSIESMQHQFEQDLGDADVQTATRELQDKSATEVQPRAAEETGGSGDTGESAAAETSTNPLEARLAKLQEFLGGKQKLAVKKLISRYTDGNITLERLVGELENYEAQATDGVRFSESQEGGADAPTITATLKKLFFSPERFDKIVKVVQSIRDLKPAEYAALSQADDPNQVQAFTTPDGRVVIIAGNVQPGQELGVFLHEVGVHVGMEKLIGADNLKRLVSQIKDWAAKADGSQESNIAIEAVRRAGTSSSTNTEEEHIAYFIEEAVKAGIDPTAVERMRGPLANWFRTLWAAAKAALRKMGLNRFDKLTAQNLVDLAYGAAKMELTGAWHGTAADFRNFDHKYMNSGEGAQAFGWGSYLAQAPGIAHGYWKADVRRKGGSLEVRNYHDMTGDDVTPEGSLMRVDTAVHDDEFLDWDNAVSDKHLALLPEKLRDYLEEYHEFYSGEDLYRSLQRIAEEGDLYDDVIAAKGYEKAPPENKKHYEDGGLTPSELAGPELTAEINDWHPKRIVSEYLDSIGIKGIKFLDENSRGMGALKIRHSTAMLSATMGQWLVDGSNGVGTLARFHTEQEAKDYVAANQGKQTRNLVIFNDKNIQRVMTEVGADKNKIKFSETRKVVHRVAGRSGEMIYDDTTHALKKLVYSMASLHDLVDEFKAALPSVKAWYEGVQNSISARKRYEGGAEEIASAADKLKKGTTKVNEFLSRATFEQKWGYDPKFANRSVTVDPEMAKAFNALSPEEQKVVKEVFAHGEKMQLAKQKILNSLGITQTFSGAGKLEGPYAPLKRFGNYIGQLKSKELRAAEVAEDAKKVSKLKADPDHYQMAMFDTMGQAKQFAQANAAKWDFTDAFEKSARVGEVRVLPADILSKVLSSVKMDDNIPANARAPMEKLITDMYFAAQDEYSARTSGLKRLNRAGYDADMIRSFLTHARAEAGFMANMEHGGAINDAFYKMQQEAKNKTTGHRVNQDAFNTIASHYAENLKYDETPWQDRAMALTSAWQLATSVGYHVTNAMQGFMVTIPKLGADFDDYRGAWTHLLAGYGVLKHTGMWGNIDLSKVTNTGLREALQKASDMGVLDVGMEEDLTRFDATRTGHAAIDKTTGAARTALHLLRRVSRAVETANRVSAAAAGYNMSIAAGKSVADAQDYAIRLLQTTQGDFSRIGSPLLLKRLPKVMTQYRKYQFMMGALYAKAFRDAFMNADPTTRAIGQRMLVYKLFHTTMAAGVLGMPLMNLVGMVFAALGGDGEPKDLERSLREMIGDKMLASLLLHGPLAAIGLDMSAKLGDEKVFSIMPYGEWDFSSAAGVKNTLFSLAGPAASQAGKFADGIGQIKEGDYYKGLEKFMPKGIESGMKAFRIANEGYTLKNDDVMFQPKDINGFALALDAIGMPSSELKRMDWLRNQQYEIKQFYTDHAKALTKQYAKASKSGDTEELAKLRRDWMELQDGKDNVRRYFGGSAVELKRQPLSSLLKSPVTTEKRELRLQRAAKEE